MFIETGAEREVKRGCKACRADPSAPQIVSPRGIAHESRGYGVTDCGVDATGPGWWWAE